MSRFLVVSLPLPGHVYPATAVAAALRERGHDVAWAGPEGYLRPILGEAATIYPTGLRPYRGQRDRGARSIKSVWEGFVVPYAKFTLAAVEKAVLAYQPDVVLVDQHALAGAVAAQRHGVRWATLATGAMELTRPFATRPKVDAWIHGHLATVWTAAGLSGPPPVDLRFSPHLVIALTSTALTGDHYAFPPHYALVGPALATRPIDQETPPAPDPDPDRQTVLVTVGTLTRDLSHDFHVRVCAALAPLGDRLRAIVVAPPELVPDPPPHFEVVPRVAMLDVLPHVDAVVCHAGQNTVCEALAHGLPLVLAPIKNDQPIVANQVVGAGAGIRVPFHRVQPERLRAAVTTVLDDQSYRAAAARISASFAAGGGAAAAADRLATLATLTTAS